MENSNKDKSSQNEVQKPDELSEGPFTPKQMRSLKLLTGTMGVMIIICVILLGIGLSRQSAKLAGDDGPTFLTLAPNADIKSITANGADGIWLYIETDDGEEIRYIKSSGKAGRTIKITRD